VRTVQSVIVVVYMLVHRRKHLY